MIEEIVLNHLLDNLDCPCYMENPSKKASEYVVIEKTSSGIENRVKFATLAIQSYAGTMHDACVLNEKVKDAMETLVEETNVSKSALNSDYNFTDTQTKEYRYQAVFDIVYL